MSYARGVWAAATAVATAYWVIVALGGGDGSPVATAASGAAAAAAAAALVGAGWRPGSVRALQRSALVLVVFPLAVAVLVQRVADERWPMPGDEGAGLALALVGAALLLAGAAFGPSVGWPLAVPALVVALAAAGHLTEPVGVAVPVVLAVAAAALAGRRPALALAALALAAAVSEVTAPAGALLAAAAVLSLVVQHPWGALLGVPGAAAVAAATVPVARSVSLTVLSAGVAAVAAAFAHHAATGRPGPPVGPPVESPAPLESLAAFALGAWLLVAPGTWAWAGRTQFDAYDRGAAAALGAAGIALVGSWALESKRPARHRTSARSEPL